MRKIGVVRTSLYIDRDTYEALEEIAEKHSLTMSSIVRLFLDIAVELYKKGKIRIGGDKLD